jgi:LmbE family N-acetylglucosaminyl deacetylase
LRGQIARLYRLTQADTLLTFDPYWTGQIHPDHRAAGQAALDAYMPSKMPLYRPEQLNEPQAGLGCLERVFFFSTDREPDIFVDVTAVYETKLAACMAHRSQFPNGEESLEWLKEIDRKQGQAIDVTYAESFKEIRVW